MKKYLSIMMIVLLLVFNLSSIYAQTLNSKDGIELLYAKPCPGEVEVRVRKAFLNQDGSFNQTYDSEIHKFKCVSTTNHTSAANHFNKLSEFHPSNLAKRGISIPDEKKYKWKGIKFSDYSVISKSEAINCNPTFYPFSSEKKSWAGEKNHYAFLVYEEKEVEKPSVPWEDLEPSKPIEKPSVPWEDLEPSKPIEKPGVPWEDLEPSKPIEKPGVPWEDLEPSKPIEKPGVPWEDLEPSKPVEPSEPEEPSKPVEPSEPEEPSKPVEPSEPEEPSKPVEPSEPEEPSKPVEPSEPEEPSKPVEPSEPEEPSKPVEPSEPEEPSKPVEPSEPEEPSKPVEPSEPEEPSKPVEPSELKKPSNKKDKFNNINPKTSDFSNLGLWSSLFIISGGSTIIRYYKKNK